MNVVNSYTYLGFTFTAKLSYKEGTDFFCSKGQEGCFSLVQSLNEVKEHDQAKLFS